MSGALVLVGDKLDFRRTLAEESRGAHLNRSALRARMERCSSRWKCTPRATSPVILYTNPKNVHSYRS